MPNLNIQNLTGLTEVYKVKPGTKPDDLVKVLEHNGKNDVVIQDGKDMYVLSGKKLAYDHKAFQVTKFLHDPHTGQKTGQTYTRQILPKPGEMVDFGGFKAYMSFHNFETKSVGTSNWGHVAGAVVGGFGGLVGTMIVADKIGMSGGGTSAPFIPKDPAGALGGFGLAVMGAVAGGIAGSYGLGALVSWGKEKLNEHDAGNKANQAKFEQMAEPLPKGQWQAGNGKPVVPQTLGKPL